MSELPDNLYIPATCNEPFSESVDVFRKHSTDVAYVRADLLLDADAVYTNINVGKINVPLSKIKALHPKCWTCDHWKTPPTGDHGHCKKLVQHVHGLDYCPSHTAFDQPKTEEEQ